MTPPSTRRTRFLLPLRRWGSLWALLTGCASAASPEPPDKTGPDWPERPVPVSQTESVIEVFWDPDFKAASRWLVMPTGESSTPTRFQSHWNRTQLDWTQSSADQSVAVSRDYAINLERDSRIVLHLKSPPGIATSISATLDGVRHDLLVEAPGTLEAQEISCDLPPAERLQSITLKFQADSSGEHSVRLTWLMLATPGEPWTAPPLEFDRYIRSSAVPAYSPGLGLVFNASEFGRMRAIYHSPPFAEVREQDRARAEAQSAVDPASLIRPYALRAGHYGRARDDQRIQYIDGLILALSGLLRENPDFMRQAAEHLIVQAKIEHWAEGFVERFPGSDWMASGFAPNVATLRAALLLDWCWNWLTPEGRELVRTAIRQKGLPYIERWRDAPANQGIRFHKGLVLGKLAIAEDRTSEEFRSLIRREIESMNALIDPMMRADGTFVEGLRYGYGSIASTIVTYKAASTCTGVPIADLVIPRTVDGLRFVVDSLGYLPAPLAAFAAGPLNSPFFEQFCHPTSVLADSGFSYREMGVFGLDWLWAPVLNDAVRPVDHIPFKVYPDGGWVFAGDEHPESPRIRLESGFWSSLGHTWRRKNAFSLDYAGIPLLISRTHVKYQDARSQYTQRTAAYNTFTPGERSQVRPHHRSGRPSLTPHHQMEAVNLGADLQLARDTGRTVVIASDAATAWETGVKKAMRRVIFIRPDIVIVDDDAVFDSPEAGVQSWNSLSPWVVSEGRAETRHEGAYATVTQLAADGLDLTAGEDSVHRDRSQGRIVPVYRATFRAPPATSHRFLTLIDSGRSGDAGNRNPSRVRVHPVDASVYAITRGKTEIRIALADGSGDALWGVESDGTLCFAIREAGVLVHAGAFDATTLRVDGEEQKGSGFLFFDRQ